jgi:predicted dehydrogenase
MDNIRIGFIGAGDISYLHGAAIGRLPGMEVAGLWSLDSALNEEKAKLFGCKQYDSAEELIRDPAIDVVFVLTHMETHAHYANLAMNAGKHVLVEKPTAVSMEELMSMQEAAERNNVALMPGHNYIHEDGLRRTKALIDDGRLGDVAQVYILYNIDHPEEVAKRYPGVIRQLMIHHLYILLYLVGKPTSLSAMKSVLSYKEYTEEDLAMVTMRLANGGLAHLASSFATDDHSSDAWTFLVKVLGTDGSTRFAYNDWVENKQAVVHSHTYSAYHFHIENEVRFFVDECVRKGTPPPSSITDSMTCLQLVEAIEKSIAERREIVI